MQPYTGTTEFLPGRSSYSKNLKTPFFGEYFKFLLLGNSNGSKTNTKKFFLKKSQKTQPLEAFKIFA